MRIKSSTSFPYPVLAEETGDYGDQAFRIELEVEETPATCDVKFRGNMTLEDPSIRDLIGSGQARSGLMISCLGTYFDHFAPMPIGDIDLTLPNGMVRGSVHVRGVVIAVVGNLRLDSDSIDLEFSNESRSVPQGGFVALTNELSFEAGLEKLAPLESIFRLKRQEGVAPGTFEIDLDSEAVEILVSPSLHDFLGLLRSHAMKDTLLSSLYLPVVMSVLDAMGDEGYADRRWHSVINARCNAEGIDVKHVDLATSAQKLLDGPLGSLQNLLEKVA